MVRYDPGRSRRDRDWDGILLCLKMNYNNYLISYLLNFNNSSSMFKLQVAMPIEAYTNH